MIENIGIALAVVLIAFIVYNLFVKRDKNTPSSGPSKPRQWPWGKGDHVDRDP